MEQFPEQVNKENEQEFNKEIFGEKFKDILKQKAGEYDETQVERNEMIAGKGFAKAIRNVSILKDGLRAFIELPSFPQKSAEEIRMRLKLIDMTDPLIDRMHYYEAEGEEKDFQAQFHNEQYGGYTASIQGLFEQLKAVLPEEMVLELWARNTMFIDPLKWADDWNNGAIED